MIDETVTLSGLEVTLDDQRSVSLASYPTEVGERKSFVIFARTGESEQRIRLSSEALDAITKMHDQLLGRASIARQLVVILSDALAQKETVK